MQLLELSSISIVDAYNLAQTCTTLQRKLDNFLYHKRGQPLLFWAASKGRRSIVESVFKKNKNTDVNFIDPADSTAALAKAISSYDDKSPQEEDVDFPGAVKLILEQPGIKWDEKANGIELLGLAIKNGFTAAVEGLLDKSEQHPIKHLYRGWTLLQVAIKYNREDIFHLLIPKVDLNQRNARHRSQTALVYAIRYHGTNKRSTWAVTPAEVLLGQPEIQLTDEANRTNMLALAIGNGFHSAVERLLDGPQQGRVNTCFPDSVTPLMAALKYGDEDVVELLLRKGADVNQRVRGRTALARAIDDYDCWSVSRQNCLSFELLLEQPGIDLTDQVNGICVFERAIMNRVYPVIKWILKNRPNQINTPFTNGLTPLMTAANLGHRYIVQLLISNGADVNQKSKRRIGIDDFTRSRYFSMGRSPTARYRQSLTALTLAAMHNHPNIIKQLLKCDNINTDIISTDASRLRYEPLQAGELLDPRKRPTSRGNPLFWAVRQGHDLCVFELLKSPRVSAKAEEVARLQKLLGAYKQSESRKLIGKLLTGCEGLNCTLARVAKFGGATGDPGIKRRALEEQSQLEKRVCVMRV